MKKPFVQKLMFVSCALIFTSFTSALQADECKIKVKYSDFPFNSKITGSERFKIPLKSSSTTLRKHMREIKNYGGRDVSIKYWDATGNHWKTVKKGKTKRISGDLKKTKCLDKINGQKPKKQVALKFEGNGLWRNNTNRPKGKYSRIETTLGKCKSMCLRSSACTGIEYTVVFKKPKKNTCELHTDKYHHLAVNYNPDAHGKVWLKK